MRSTTMLTRLSVLMLLSVFTVLALGCGKKDGGPDCGALYDKMTKCAADPEIGSCALGINPPPKDAWIKTCSSDSDSKAAWTDVTARCMKRECKDFCACAFDTIARRNGVKDAKEWDVQK